VVAVRVRIRASVGRPGRLRLRRISAPPRDRTRALDPATPSGRPACGCRLFGHLMRPAHTHGSAHRVDLVV